MGTLLSTAEAAPDPGAIQSTDKAANYQIHEKLGSGAFGTVYRAIRKSDSLEVAIKQIRKRHQAHTSSSLKDEIDIMEKCAKLNNKHLLQLFAVFEDPTFCNLVIELATGLELFDRVAQQKRFTERAAREALLQILDGVQALHSMGILHRDLKPENCLYATMGGSLLKIGDFGLGVDLGSDKDGGLNHVGLRAVGSMNYCAPEVIAKRQYSVTTDLWAVGVMMYVLLVGRYPYDQHAGEDCPKEKLKQDVEQGNVLERSDAWKEEDWADVSDEAMQLVRAMLVKDPRSRLATVEQVLASSWFQLDAEFSEALDRVPSNIDKPLPSHSRFKHFNARRKFQLAVSATMLGLNIVRLGAPGTPRLSTMTSPSKPARASSPRKKRKRGAQFKIELAEEPQADLRELFELFDKDGDGQLSREEIGEMLRTLGTAENASEAHLQRVMEQIDNDGNGTVSYEEFLPVVNVFQSKKSTSDLREAFDIFDKNGDGGMSVAELRDLAQTMGWGLSDADLEEMIKEADTDGDGTIDFMEFVRMLQS